MDLECNISYDLVRDSFFQFYGIFSSIYKSSSKNVYDSYEVRTRPPQDVDVLAVLDFQNPCYRPETPGFYPRCLLTMKSMGES